MENFAAAQPFSILEGVFYAVMNAFPYTFPVLAAFRRRWRFGASATFILTAVIALLQTATTVLRLFLPYGRSPLFDVAISLLYIAFIFLVIRDHVGRLVFTILVLTNVGNLVNVLSKCAEGLLFPSFAPLRYHVTYPLLMLPVQLVLLPLIYLLVFRGLCPDDAEEDANSGFVWRYLWLIPAVFYLIWMQHFYASGKTALESAMDPLGTLYLLLINAGSVLIYRVIVQLERTRANNRRLLAENHALNLRSVQYESLRRRVEETRQARHDLRHHIILLRKVRDEHDFAALDELLAGYPDLEALDRPLLYCRNETVNALLTHFGDQAAELGIRYTVKIDVPENVFIDQPDLAVLFGNLLENAVEACSHLEGERYITVSGVASGRGNMQDSLTLIVENSCIDAPPIPENGAFRSTKHSGDGIGVASVRSIAERYNGTSSFAEKDGVFTASVILFPRIGQAKAYRHELK